MRIQQQSLQKTSISCEKSAQIMMIEIDIVVFFLLDDCAFSSLLTGARARCRPHERQDDDGDDTKREFSGSNGPDWAGVGSAGYGEAYRVDPQETLCRPDAAPAGSADGKR